MKQDEFELYLKEKTSFSQRFANDIYNAIKFKFPEIIGLDVFFDKDYELSVLFEESEKITRNEVESFLNEFKFKKSVL